MCTPPEYPSLQITKTNLFSGQNGFFTTSDGKYFFLNSSGTVNAELIDDVEGNLGTGRWIFELGQSTQITADLQCYQWYEKERTVRRNTNPNLSCPSHADLASLDARFSRESVTETNRRVCFVNVLPSEGPAVRCCYGKNLGGSLITTPPLAGSALNKNPLYSNETNDLYGYTKCCVESNRCEAYFSLLPIERGRNYKAPHWGR